MGRVDLPYVDAIPVKGRTYYYYRRDGLRQRITGQPGDRDFQQAYDRLHQQAEAIAAKPDPQGIIPGSLRALVAAYRTSAEWREKAPGTQRDYEKALRPLESKFGQLQVASLPRAFVLRLRDEYAFKPGATPDDPRIATPRRANGIVAVLSILFSFAIDRGWRPDNPALRPRRLRGGEGHRAWSDAELEQMLAAETTPAGIRLAVLMAVGTGQRGQDLIEMTWAAFDGTAVEVVQGKTKAKVWVPLHPRARKALLRLERKDGTILTRPDGEKWKIDHFRHAMGAAIRDAGLAGLVTHGLRATAARWMAEAGCSEREIMSITGHTTSNMVSRYVREAEQKVRAKGAAAKVALHQKDGANSLSAKRRRRPVLNH